LSTFNGYGQADAADEKTKANDLTVNGKAALVVKMPRATSSSGSQRHMEALEEFAWS